MQRVKKFLFARVRFHKDQRGVYCADLAALVFAVFAVVGLLGGFLETSAQIKLMLAALAAFLLPLLELIPKLHDLSVIRDPAKEKEVSAEVKRRLLTVAVLLLAIFRVWNRYRFRLRVENGIVSHIFNE